MRAKLVLEYGVVLMAPQILIFSVIVTALGSAKIFILSLQHRKLVLHAH